MCVVRDEHGRWLAGRRAAWLATWANKWALGAGRRRRGRRVARGDAVARARRGVAADAARLSVEALVAAAVGPRRAGRPGDRARRAPSPCPTPSTTSSHGGRPTRGSGPTRPTSGCAGWRCCWRRRRAARWRSERSDLRTGFRKGLPFVCPDVRGRRLVRRAGRAGDGCRSPRSSMSILVFAGSAQFAALGVLGAGGAACGGDRRRASDERALPADGLRVRARRCAAGRSSARREGQAVIDASWAIARRPDGTFDRDILLGATIPQGDRLDHGHRRRRLRRVRARRPRASTASTRSSRRSSCSLLFAEGGSRTRSLVALIGGAITLALMSFVPGRAGGHRRGGRGADRATVAPMSDGLADDRARSASARSRSSRSGPVISAAASPASARSRSSPCSRPRCWRRWSSTRRWREGQAGSRSTSAWSASPRRRPRWRCGRRWRSS